MTVAGSSGVTNQTPPDVEMRLTFAKPNGDERPAVDDGQYNGGVMQYNSHQTHISRSKRQGEHILDVYSTVWKRRKVCLRYRAAQGRSGPQIWFLEQPPPHTHTPSPSPTLKSISKTVFILLPDFEPGSEGKFPTWLSGLLRYQIK